MLKEEGGAKIGNIPYPRDDCESREHKLRKEEIQNGLKRDVCLCCRDDQAEAKEPEAKRAKVVSLD